MTLTLEIDQCFVYLYLPMTKTCQLHLNNQLIYLDNFLSKDYTRSSHFSLQIGLTITRAGTNFTRQTMKNILRSQPSRDDFPSTLNPKLSRVCTLILTLYILLSRIANNFLNAKQGWMEKLEKLLYIVVMIVKCFTVIH
jgi:hypothetical protein